MKHFWIAGFLAAGLVLMGESVAQQAPETESAMQITFANTLVTRSETGPATQWLFEPDGAYQSVGADGAVSRGLWTEEEGETCITPEGGSQTCLALVPDGAQPGQTWTTPLPSGAALTVTLNPGRN